MIKANKFRQSDRIQNLFSGAIDMAYGFRAFVMLPEESILIPSTMSNRSQSISNSGSSESDSSGHLSHMYSPACNSM